MTLNDPFSKNSADDQTANLIGSLFNMRRFAPWYDDRADYNTDAKSYYDYLARNNKIMEAIVLLVNKLSNDVSNLKPQNLQPLKDDISKLKSDVLELDQPLTRLANQNIIKMVDVYFQGTKAFIQGVQPIQDRDEIYFIYKDGNLASEIIARYRLSDMKMLDYRTVETASKIAYTENLSYFISENDEVCFFLRNTYDNDMFIFNYTKNIKGDIFVMAGMAKIAMDVNRKYIISNYGNAPQLQGLFVFDFDSVKNMHPKLIRQIPLDMDIMYGEKVQGISIIDNHIVLNHGYRQPKLTVLTMTGKVVNTISLDKNSVRDFAKEAFPTANLGYTDIVYEAEGSSNYFVDGKEYLLVTHVFYQSKKAYLAVVGNKDYKKVKIKETPNNEVYPHWIPITELLNDFKPYDNDPMNAPMFMLDNNGLIHFRGVLTYPPRDTSKPYTTYNKVMFNLPYPYFLYHQGTFKTQASGSPMATNRIRVSANQDIRGISVMLDSTSDESTTKPYLSIDGITIATDTRYSHEDKLGAYK